MLWINASIKDAIDRVAYLVEYCKEIPSQKRTIECDLDETDIGLIKKILCDNDISNCNFSNNCLVITLPITPEEITEKQEDTQSNAQYWARCLVKWAGQEKYRLQIEQYLQKYADKYAAVIAMMEEQKQYINQKGN